MMNLQTARKIISVVNEAVRQYSRLNKLEEARAYIRKELEQANIGVDDVSSLVREAEEFLDNTEGTPEHLATVYQDKYDRVKKKHPYDNKERAEALAKVDAEFDRVYREHKEKGLFI